MDALKLQRKTLRMTFTNTVKNINEEITKMKVDVSKIRELSSLLSDKFKRLEETQNAISELLLGDGDEIQEKEYVKDFGEAESYREQYFSLKLKIENFENSDDKISQSPCNRKYRLPKLEIQKFNGDTKAFLGFWSQFSRIHEDEEMPAEDKFQYLIQAITPGSRAASLIESFPPTAQNYPKAIELLKERFGREDLLVQVYVRELLKMVMKNAISGRKCTDLTTLYDQLESHLRALDTLGRSKEKFADFLSPLIESCLPEDVLRTWERYRVSSMANDSDEVAECSQRSLEKLMKFLRQEVNGEEMINLARSSFGTQVKVKKENDTFKNSIPSASALISSMKERAKCVFCEKHHPSQDCGKATIMSQEQKRAVVIKKGVCLVCLKSGHMDQKCHSNVRCVICKKRHYVILCPELPKTNRSNDAAIPTRLPEEVNAAALFSKPSSQNVIYLKTLMVRLQNKDRIQYVRALLDDGSHRSYIERELADELQLSPSGKEVLSLGLFGGRQTPEVTHTRYCVKIGSINGKASCRVLVLDQPKICMTLPRVRDKNLLAELENNGIFLTDIGENTPPIKMLLGADVLGKILTGRVQVLKSGISAIETIFGWSILGCVKKASTIAMVSVCLQNFQIPKIWELDVIGIIDPIEKKNTKILEEETLEHFKANVQRYENRYEVALPWLAGHPPVYDKFDVAESRLRTVTKRLVKEKLYEAYDDVFKQWKKDEIIEIVPKNEIERPSHYLPHRPVIKLTSNTTKIRPVFDASFKLTGYASLNECLSVGPSLSQQIPPLLSRFRSKAIGVIADIKQAFLQLNMKSEDRDYLRFLLWKEDDRSELEFFRHKRVVFGVTSSPFLLNATIKHHLSLEEFQKDSFKDTVEKLKGGFYVDNLTVSVESEKELEIFKKQALEVMNTASFELRCWAHSGIQGPEQNVLGLKWDTKTDELFCVSSKIDVKDDEIITKRKLLSIVNSIYDPIGFTSPATLFPKILLQEAWISKIRWDEELPLDIQRRYQRWAKHIDLLTECRIPRRIFYGPPDKASLHVFTDASSHGYACCAFIRSENDNDIKVSLVAAKARVAPVQRPTIPRLELLAATIGARMAASIQEDLHLPLKTTLWTDSMVVLGWITKRLNWPLGLVLELFKGKDNVERVAKLRVANREIIRPVHRIFPLELNANEIPMNILKSRESASDAQNGAHDIPEVKTPVSKTPKNAVSPDKDKHTRCGRRVRPVKRLDL